MMSNFANQPDRRTWLNVPENSDFPIQNIPFGIFKANGEKPCVGTRIGDTVIDLHFLARQGHFKSINGLNPLVFESQYLNDFISLGKNITRKVRNRIADLFDKKNDTLTLDKRLHDWFLYPIENVEMLMPIKVGDYTDFYSSRDHATNVGTMFRDPENALLPNWLHLPVGYHGRASSIIPSGVPIRRPKGQQIPPNAKQPIFGASKLLDFELEVGFIIGKSTEMGQSISTAEAEDHIFGLVLFNDWSARDIQKWEYVPLGPFLGKSFASSISPWVVTLDALEPFRVAGEVQDPKVLPYLEFEGKKNYNLNLEVIIQTESGAAKTVSNSNFKYMYWNMCQQLAHHTVNGCNVNVGDMCASGTISGPTPDSYGSMLEISWRGTKPVQMPDGTERKFIHDGDTVIMRGFGEQNGTRIGFGEVSTKVLPAT